MPPLRFKGFDENWEENKLRNLAEKVKSYSLSRNLEKTENTGFKYIHYGDIHRGIAQIISSDEILPNIQVGNFELLKNGDLVIADVSEDYEGVGSACVIDGDLKNKIVSGLHTIAIRPSQSGPLFLYYLLKTQAFKEYGRLIGTGTKVVGITANRFLDFSSYFPTLPEQTVIGNFFRQLDDQIAQSRAVWQKSIQLKKAMLSKMFPTSDNLKPEVRFKGFSGDWDRKKLGDFAKKVIEKNHDVIFSETFTNSAEFGVVSQKDYFDNGISNFNNIKGYYIVQPNDFIYNPRISSFAPVGPVNRNKLNRIGIVSPLYLVFKVDSEIVEYQFLDAYFKSNIWHSFMFLNGDSGARSDRLAIKDSIFMQLPFKLPSYEEQTAIGNFFRQLDNTIALQSAELTKLNQLKKGLLSAMLV